MFFHDFFSRQRYYENLRELEEHYTLTEKIDSTPQTLAIFRRHP
ncbi:MAG: hypothetical protein AAF514_20170 [Verrucomicrobiota bacterium]